MTAARTRVVALADDLDLTVREAGAGAPVLLLHGGAGPASIPDAFSRLARTHHVIAPFHPGWAGTPRPDRLGDVPALAATYADLLDRLGLDDILVVGSSFGGWVAAELALLDPANPTSGRRRVGRLVLLDAVGPTPAPGDRPARPAAVSGTPGPTQADQALLVSYTGPAMHDPGLRQRLAAVTVPVLVVWGEDDPVLAPSYGEAYATAYPAGRFALVPGAGHLPSEEAPDATFAAVEHFLDRTTPALEETP